MYICGTIIGELKLVRPVRAASGHMEWECLCSCGNTRNIRESHMKTGRSSTCGHCNHKENHPFAHKSWDSMLQRCNNPNAPDYPRYGGRGIIVYKEWELKFINFYKDLGDPPIDETTGNRYTLDRINNNGNYTPDNCRWASHTEQCNNKSNNVTKYYASLRDKS